MERKGREGGEGGGRWVARWRDSIAKGGGTVGGEI
jgi:hypothetical protein